MLAEAQEAVYQFHKTFNLPNSDVPKRLETSRVHLRVKWMKEELDEFLHASDIVNQADAVIDLIYFALGVLVEMGVNGDELFRIVHRANMSKLGADQKPLYNEEGKVTKPKDWVAPEAAIGEILLNEE